MQPGQQVQGIQFAGTEGGRISGKASHVETPPAPTAVLEASTLDEWLVAPPAPVALVAVIVDVPHETAPTIVTT